MSSVRAPAAAGVALLQRQDAADARVAHRVHDGQHPGAPVGRAQHEEPRGGERGARLGPSGRALPPERPAAPARAGHGAACCPGARRARRWMEPDLSYARAVRPWRELRCPAPSRCVQEATAPCKKPSLQPRFEWPSIAGGRTLLVHAVRVMWANVGGSAGRMAVGLQQQVCVLTQMQSEDCGPHPPSGSARRDCVGRPGQALRAARGGRACIRNGVLRGRRRGAALTRAARRAGVLRAAGD